MPRSILIRSVIGLAALLVGGVGVSTAVRSYLDSKTATVATLKCLGASGALVFRTYLLLILLLACGGVVAGLVVGATVPPLVGGLLARQIAIAPQIAIFPQPLATAAAFGLLTAVGFSLWPLARARDVRAVQLFRDLVQHARSRPRRGDLAAIGLVGLALAALVLLWAVFVAARARYGALASEALGVPALTFLPAELCVLLLAGGMLLGCLGGFVVARSVR